MLKNGFLRQDPDQADLSILEGEPPGLSCAYLDKGAAVKMARRSSAANEALVDAIAPHLICFVSYLPDLTHPDPGFAFSNNIPAIVTLFLSCPCSSAICSLGHSTLAT